MSDQEHDEGRTAGPTGPSEPGADERGGEAAGGPEDRPTGERSDPGRREGPEDRGAPSSEEEPGPETEEGEADPRSHGWGGTISEMQNLVGDVVGEVLEGVRDAAGGRRFPRVDMVRTADGDYRVVADLPGVDREHLEVTTLGGELTIAGERPRPELDEGEEVLRTERGFGSFRRTLRLPPDVREEDVAARLEEGELVVRLPRKAPSEARTVDID